MDKDLMNRVDTQIGNKMIDGATITYESGAGFSFDEIGEEIITKASLSELLTSILQS